MTTTEPESTTPASELPEAEPTWLCPGCDLLMPLADQADHPLHYRGSYFDPKSQSVKIGLIAVTPAEDA